jgi:hypothetical protein
LTITASHELLEMGVDPMGQYTASAPDIDPNSDGHNVNYLLEVGGPCEIYSYIINNVQVSDFVTPDYYVYGSNHNTFDYLHRLSSPLKVPDGCYISWEDPNDRLWHQKKPNGPFVRGINEIRRNTREMIDTSFGSEEELKRHNLSEILKSHSKK